MSRLVVENRIGYTLAGSANTSSPSDATTYYFGSVPVQALSTSADTQRLYVVKSGTVRLARVTFNNSGTLGSNETSTISLRLNNTTDTAISAAVTNDAVSTSFVNSALAIPVVQGDYFEFKWAAPTWATNPTNVRVFGQIYID